MVPNLSGGEWLITDLHKCDNWDYLKVVTVFMTDGKDVLEISFRKTLSGLWIIDLGAFWNEDRGSTPISTLPKAVKRKLREAYAMMALI